MVAPVQQETLQGRSVHGELPGPRSAELLARRDRRESNARLYPRHVPIAIADAAGEQLAQAFDRLRTHPWVREARGRGLIWGIELADPRNGRHAGDLLQECCPSPGR